MSKNLVNPYPEIFETVKKNPSKSYHNTEVAKMIRYELAVNFPGVKFSVTCKSFSMGCSIDVNWIDGPTDKEVNAKIGQFTDKGFDGMTDSSYYYRHAITPNGIINLGSNHYGDNNLQACPANALIINLYTGWLSTHRELSDNAQEQIVKTFNEKYGRNYTLKQVKNGEIYDMSDRHWLYDIEKDFSLYVKPVETKKVKAASSKKESKYTKSETTKISDFEISYEGDWTWINLNRRVSIEGFKMLVSIPKWGYSRNRKQYFIKTKANFETVKAILDNVK